MDCVQVDVGARCDGVGEVASMSVVGATWLELVGAWGDVGGGVDA